MRAAQSFGGLSLLFVMATEHEYGPHLKRMIRPVITGVGPVEAAAGTALALTAGPAPDLVVSLGSAGSRLLDHAGVYQISAVSYRDMDASALGFERGVTPFLHEPAIALLETPIDNVRAASISTGGDIVSGAAYDRIAADMVDMESWGVYRATRRISVPMIGLRGITDGRSELTGLSDWTDYLHLVDEGLALALERLEAVVRGGWRPAPLRGMDKASR